MSNDTVLPGTYLSGFIRQLRRLPTAVGLIDISHIQNAGDQHLACHMPFEQSNGPLNGEADAIQYRHILPLCFSD